MSRKSRIMAVSLAAVTMMLVVSTSASAFTFAAPFVNWRVNGTLTIKKLNQTIVFPQGTFNGEAEIELPALTGAVSGTTAIPTFETTIQILGLPAKVELSFEQVGNVEGSIAGTAGCEERPACVDLSVPTKANLVVDKLEILGITFGERCETSSPGLLNLNDVLTVSELVSVGSHFTGTTNIALMRCNGFFGLYNGGVLSLLMSGPGNPYSISISPPA